MKKITIFIALMFFLVSASTEAMTSRQLERIDELKKEATELLKNREFDKAIPVLNEILTIDPLEKTAHRYLNIARQQSIEPFCEEAAEAFMNDDYAKAIGTWEKILRLNPGDYRFSRLIEVTKNLISDKTIEEMYANAEEFIKAGDRSSAVNELEKILSIKPFDKRAREMLVTAKQSVSDKKTKIHYEQAEKYMKEKKYELAIEEWNKILEIDDTQEAAKRLIAKAVRKKISGQYGEAKKLYEKGDYLSSRDKYYKILVDNPTDTDVKKIISNLDETVKMVSRLDGRDKASVMMRKSLNNHIDINGNKRAAVAASWYAVQLDPMNTNTLAIKNFMEQKYSALLSSMDAPIGDMNVIDQYLFAALNHIYEGRYDRSIQESSIVIELQPDNLLAWKRLGSAYFAMNQKDKARKAWKTALKIAPNDAELKQFLKQTKK
jgi:tetratricopeptide (TPR) repeat protein